MTYLGHHRQVVHSDVVIHAQCHWSPWYGNAKGKEFQWIMGFTGFLSLTSFLTIPHKPTIRCTIALRHNLGSCWRCVINSQRVAQGQSLITATAGSKDIENILKGFFRYCIINYDLGKVSHVARHAYGQTDARDTRLTVRNSFTSSSLSFWYAILSGNQSSNGNLVFHETLRWPLSLGLDLNTEYCWLPMSMNFPMLE